MTEFDWKHSAASDSLPRGAWPSRRGWHDVERLGLRRSWRDAAVSFGAALVLFTIAALTAQAQTVGPEPDPSFLANPGRTTGETNNRAAAAQSPASQPSTQPSQPGTPSGAVKPVESDGLITVHGIAPRTWSDWIYDNLTLLIILLVLAMLAVGGLVYWLVTRSGERDKLPSEKALDLLAQARALLVPEKVREYSYTVSEIVREYIEERFRVRAAHRTTEEFLHDLLAESEQPVGVETDIWKAEARQMLSQHSESLRKFLRTCDVVKFARGSLTISEMEGMHESAEQFVRETGQAPDHHLAVHESSAAWSSEADSDSTMPTHESVADFAEDADRETGRNALPPVPGNTGGSSTSSPRTPSTPRREPASPYAPKG